MVLGDTTPISSRSELESVASFLGGDEGERDVVFNDFMVIARGLVVLFVICSPERSTINLYPNLSTLTSQ